MLADTFGRPLRFIVTAGQASDITQAPALLKGQTGDAVLADKAYDSNPLRDIITDMAAEAVIPSKRNRKVFIPHDTAAYKHRNQIERCFNRLKHFRRFATRYDRRTIHFSEAYAVHEPWLKSRYNDYGKNFRDRVTLGAFLFTGDKLDPYQGAGVLLVALGIGIGISTGPVAAALLGSEERVEYTLVGDTVNLAQRLQDLARPSGRIVINESTYAALHSDVNGVALDETTVKGRNSPVRAYRIDVFDNMERGFAHE